MDPLFQLVMDACLAQLERSPLYFANVYLFFLWPPYSPAQVNGGSQNFTRGGP